MAGSCECTCIIVHLHPAGSKYSQGRSRAEVLHFIAESALYCVLPAAAGPDAVQRRPTAKALRSRIRVAPMWSIGRSWKLQVLRERHCENYDASSGSPESWFGRLQASVSFVYCLWPAGMLLQRAWDEGKVNHPETVFTVKGTLCFSLTRRFESGGITHGFAGSRTPRLMPHERGRLQLHKI